MANLITIGRLALLFVAIALVYSHSYHLVALSILLIAVVFASDGLDGFVARHRHSTSDFGAVLDIAGDRVVENALWIVFAQLNLIGIWAPLVVMTRGFLVDAMRAVTFAETGKSAFGANTMMLTPLSTFLTASRFMRAFYGAAKALGFLFLAGLVASRVPDASGSSLALLYAHASFRAIGWFMVYSALALTIIRGVPVIYDAMFYLRGTGEDAR